jgi:hypothetical protein
MNKGLGSRGLYTLIHQTIPVDGLSLCGALDLSGTGSDLSSEEHILRLGITFRNFGNI